MEGMIACRVTVAMVDAPLGSEVWVPEDAAWLPAMLAEGILVPLAGPLGGEGRDAEPDQVETAADDVPELLEAPTAAEAVAVADASDDPGNGHEQID